MLYKICTIIILTIFYGIYVGKMMSQKRKGIQTDQIAKGDKGKDVLTVEFVMKIATYGVVAMELISLSLDLSILPVPVRGMGIIIGMIGNVIFAIAVFTMRDSWRAGISKVDKTNIITKGIYGLSRNPAFVGFDLVYIGILLIYFNWLLLFMSLFAVTMLHLQILQEETFLPTMFGQEYIDYKDNVKRYWGKKVNK